MLDAGMSNNSTAGNCPNECAALVETTRCGTMYRASGRISKGLKKGDVATVVERHASVGGEDGYSLEIFNALGDTMAVVTVPESMIEPLTRDEVFTVRSVQTG